MLQGTGWKEILLKSTGKISYVHSRNERAKSLREYGIFHPIQLMIAKLNENPRLYVSTLLRQLIKSAESQDEFEVWLKDSLEHLLQLRVSRDVLSTIIRASCVDGLHLGIDRKKLCGKLANCEDLLSSQGHYQCQRAAGTALHVEAIEFRAIRFTQSGYLNRIGVRVLEGQEKMFGLWMNSARLRRLIELFKFDKVRSVAVAGKRFLAAALPSPQFLIGTRFHIDRDLQGPEDFLSTNTEIHLCKSDRSRANALGQQLFTNVQHQAVHY